MSSKAQPSPTLTKLKTKNEVPAGFESLEGPQTTAVDVYYGGEFLGAFEATFTDDTIQFSRPDSIVELLPGLKSPPEVMVALSGELSTHRDRICRTKHQTKEQNCGHLETMETGVIFDASQFKAEIFLSPDHVIQATRGAPKFLQPQSHHPSLVLEIGGSHAGSDHSQAQTSIGVDATAAKGIYRIESSVRGTDREAGVDMDRVVFAADIDERRWTAGYFRTESDPIVGQKDVLGARMATTLDTRADLEQVAGSEIVLFLARRSQIRVLRYGQILSSQFLPAGSQVLDTSRFPEGAYEIEIEIREIGGSEYTETRFFVKSLSIPPLDSPKYFIEGGQLRERSPRDREFAVTDDSIFSAGLGRQVLPGLGADLSATILRDLTLGSLGVFWLNENFRINSSVTFASDHSLGHSFGTTMDFHPLTASVNHSQFYRAGRPLAGDPLALPGSYEQGSLDVSWAASRVTSKLRLNLRDDGAQGRVTSLTPSLRMPFRVAQRTRLDFELESTWRSNGEFLAMLQLRVEDWLLPRVRASGKGGAQASRTANSSETKVASLAQAGIVWEREGVEGESKVVQANAEKSQETKTLDVSTQAVQDLGSYNLYAGLSDTSGSQFRYGGDFDFNFATSGEAFAFGGRQNASSAALISLDGTPPGAVFNVLVDGTYRGKVKVGSKTLLPLAPYRAYEIRIEPADNRVTEFKAQPKKVVVFPGNVELLEWSVDRLLILVARLVQPNGSPVANARAVARGGLFITSDDLGYFQAEVQSGIQELKFTYEGEKACSVDLSQRERPTEGDLWPLEELTCH